VEAGGATYERLAYEAAQRALDKQERLLEELRSRTGLLLAAASLAASFLGREAFAVDPKRGLALLAVLSFLLAVGASVYILLPKRNKFVSRSSARDCTRACTHRTRRSGRGLPPPRLRPRSVLGRDRRRIAEAV
jgi:hypothetical protein